MIQAKVKAKNIIDNLPDDISTDEIIHELLLDKMIDAGIKDSQSGKTISNQEMSDIIKKW